MQRGGLILAFKVVKGPTDVRGCRGIPVQVRRNETPTAKKRKTVTKAVNTGRTKTICHTIGQ